MCKIKRVNKSEMDICISHSELVWKGENRCGMDGKFKGDLKELLRELGGGNVKMDYDGTVISVRGEEWVEKGSIWEKVWCMEWREVESDMWEVNKVEVRSEARW